MSGVEGAGGVGPENDEADAGTSVGEPEETPTDEASGGDSSAEPEETPPDEASVVALVLARSTDAAQEATADFAESGFTVGPPSGPTFAIEGSPATFEDVFGTAPVLAGDGGWTTDRGDDFPLDRLPDRLRQQVAAVALERPAELHGFGAPPDDGAGER